MTMDIHVVVLQSSSYEEVVEMLGQTLAQNTVGFLMDLVRVPETGIRDWGHHTPAAVG